MNEDLFMDKIMYESTKEKGQTHKIFKGELCIILKNPVRYFLRLITAVVNIKVLSTFDANKKVAYSNKSSKSNISLINDKTEINLPVIYGENKYQSRTKILSLHLSISFQK